MEPKERTSERPIWLRIWQFPLVAMMIALVALLGGAALCVALLELATGRLLNEGEQAIWGPPMLALFSIVVYKLVVPRLGRHKHDDLPAKRAIGDTAKGFAGGGLLISICVALAAVTGVYAIEGPGTGSDVLFIVLVTGIYAGVFEEILLRGIIFRWLEEFGGSWIALALSSLLFGFLHAENDNATFFSSLAIAIEAGIVLGGAYMLTRSLWLAIGLHAGWNVIQGLWDVPVSGNDVDSVISARLEGPSLLAGGGFGLEATVFALVVATSAGLWLCWEAAKKGHVVEPMWVRKGRPITAY